MANIELEGVDEMLNKLQGIGANIGKLENKALRNAAEPVLEDAKRNVPVKTGKLKNGLKITNVKRKEGLKYILVGVDRGDNSQIFYGKFIEFGTKNRAAQPFLQPAYEKNKNTIQRNIATTLKEGLKW